MENRSILLRTYRIMSAAQNSQLDRLVIGRGARVGGCSSSCCRCNTWGLGSGSFRRFDNTDSEFALARRGVADRREEADGTSCLNVCCIKVISRTLLQATSDMDRFGTFALGALNCTSDLRETD